jgi:hypothetical protein
VEVGWSGKGDKAAVVVVGELQQQRRDVACGIVEGRMVVVVALGAAGGADVGGQVLVVDE